MNEKLIEEIADFMHDQWINWMKNVFTKGQLTDCSPDFVNLPEDEEDFHIFREDYDHWKRQMETPYAKLTEKEKDSDKEWAKKLIEKFITCSYCKKRTTMDICNTCRTNPALWEASEL